MSWVHSMRSKSIYCVRNQFYKILNRSDASLITLLKMRVLSSGTLIKNSPVFELKKKGIELTTFQRTQLPQLTDFLENILKLSEDEVMEIVCCNNGHILNVNFPLLLSKVEYLQRNYLVKSYQLSKILTVSPKWIYRPLSDLKNLLDRLTGNAIALDEVGKVLAKYPAILFLSEEEFGNRMSFFDDNYFTTNEVRSILLSNPSILAYNSVVLEKIYSYLRDTYNMTHEEMIDCMVFKYSYKFVFSRFEFMRKRGLYFGRDKRGIYPAMRQVHPRRILTSSDKSFLVEVALSTHEEFENFCKSFSEKIKAELNFYEANFSDGEEVDEEPQNGTKLEQSDSTPFDDLLWKYMKEKYM